MGWAEARGWGHRHAIGTAGSDRRGAAQSIRPHPPAQHARGIPSMRPAPHLASRMPRKSCSDSAFSVSMPAASNAAMRSCVCVPRTGSAAVPLEEESSCAPLRSGRGPSNSTCRRAAGQGSSQEGRFQQSCGSRLAQGREQPQGGAAGPARQPLSPLAANPAHPPAACRPFFSRGGPASWPAPASWAGAWRRRRPTPRPRRAASS